MFVDRNGVNNGGRGREKQHTIYTRDRRDFSCSDGECGGTPLLTCDDYLLVCTAYNGKVESYSHLQPPFLTEDGAVS